ncbi:MAG TPA: family 16 glycoside hydrolase [Planctomycetota bacterium]|nr:family 16 glycoside hydrolase [Planctomycetota bacterium]
MRALLLAAIALVGGCTAATPNPKPVKSLPAAQGPQAPPSAAPAAAPVVQAPAPANTPREHGLSVRFYFVGEPLEKLFPLMNGQTPNVSEVVPVLDLESDKEDKAHGMQYTFVTVVDGFLVVDAPGKYVLRLVSDDGSTLFLDGKPLIDHDGLHSFKAKDAEIELAAGEHPILIRHFQTYGGWGLSLRWKTPGATEFEVVPTTALACQAGEVRVTSPGPKKIIRPLDKGSPGDGLPLVDVHPSFDLMTVRPEGFEPRVGGIAWLPDGRMLVSTWDSDGCVWILDGVQGDDRAKITSKRFAAGLAEPLGLCTVGERVFVLQKQELTELVDLDHDGVADEYRCVCSAWNVTANFHEFAFGLVFQDGWFYFNLAIAINPGGKSTKPQVQGRGETLRVKLEDGSVETVAHGLRTPNGIGFGVGGDIFLTDNQGDWLPSSKLLHLEKGAFYGSRAVLLEKAADLAVTPPVLWMPQNEIGNSPSNPTLIPPGVGPYSGQMCHGDVTHGGVKRDFVEKVDGVWQGCIFRWSQGLEAGINRSSWGPDGALYVGGIGSTGNWGQEGKKRFGLQRLKYNGKPTFELLAVRARSDGFDVEFTEPLAEDVGWERENWHVEQWRYVPTDEYGGPKVDLEELKGVAASISADRKTAFLRIDGLKPDHVVYLHIVGPLVARSGRTLWSTEAWYTLNRIPAGSPVTVLPPPPPRPQNALTEAEAKEGWRLLFDGKTTNGWRGYKAKAAPAGWQVKDGVLGRAGEAGDLVTDEEFGDFELALDWRIAEGGNSGVFFHVSEDHGYVWETGPEMQILDNEHHPDGKDPRTSAGSNYALNAPKWDATRPVGLWNSARILVQGSHVEHWLNGKKLLEYELGSTEWKELVAASKFASMPGYGKNAKGHIALQDHGDTVEFRNVKIRVPPAH